MTHSSQVLSPEDLWYRNYCDELKARVAAEHRAAAILAAHEHLANDVGLAVHLRYVEAKNKRLVWRVQSLEREATARNAQLRELLDRVGPRRTWWHRIFNWSRE